MVQRKRVGSFRQACRERKDFQAEEILGQEPRGRKMRMVFRKEKVGHLLLKKGLLPRGTRGGGGGVGWTGSLGLVDASYSI